jgi:hypothetical protein
MPREALATLFEHLRQLNELLALPPGDAVELVADDPRRVLLERHSATGPPRSLTPAMEPEKLLDVLRAMIAEAESPPR